MKESLPYSTSLMPKFLSQIRKSFQLIFLLSLAGIVSERQLCAQSENMKKETVVSEGQPDTDVQDTLFHDPQKAVLYSSILPGLGQIYNKKVWKVPIIYAGFGTFVYFIDRNQRYYIDLKSKLMDPDYELKYFQGDFTDDQLTNGKDTFKRWRDMSIIGTVGFYVLQILDATVDAYMYNWNVDEDISLKIGPTSLPGPFLDNYSLGLRASLSF